MSIDLTNKPQVPDHVCEPEEVCVGLMVTLTLDQIRSRFPEYDEATLQKLVQRYAPLIAAQMVAAGMVATDQLLNQKRGLQ